MNKKTKIVLLLLATVYGLHKKLQHDTIYRFPRIDRKVAVKAYNRVMRDALTSKLPKDDMSEEEMDLHFLDYVYEIDPSYLN